MVALVKETSRISLELDLELIARVERQVEFTGIPRAALLEMAVLAMVRQFEAIDAECGVGCPECGALTEVDTFKDGTFRVCVRCHWRWREIDA